LACCPRRFLERHFSVPPRRLPFQVPHRPPGQRYRLPIGQNVKSLIFYGPGGREIRRRPANVGDVCKGGSLQPPAPPARRGGITGLAWDKMLLTERGIRGDRSARAHGRRSDALAAGPHCDFRGSVWGPLAVFRRKGTPVREPNPPVRSCQSGSRRRTVAVMACVPRRR